MSIFVSESPGHRVDAHFPASEDYWHVNHSDAGSKTQFYVMAINIWLFLYTKSVEQYWMVLVPVICPIPYKPLEVKGLYQKPL